jgi:hypothetical protein
VKHVFIVGCPRSGTSWLQLLLAQHPTVATTQETHLFNHYLRPLGQGWERLKSWPSAIGMRVMFTDDEFYALCGGFARSVLQRIADGNPTATVVLEKTPDHVRMAPFILRLLPDAYFIHLIRDPRSVVSSLRAAAQTWGTPWPPESVRRNARMWVSDVTQGRAISRFTAHYRELRYEDLSGEQGAQLFADLLTWLEIPASAEFVAGAFEACRIDRLRQGGHGVRAYDALKRSEANFFRKGTTDGWKEDLSPAQRAVVEYIAGDLMRACGYAVTSTWPASKPLRLSIADALDNTVSTIRARLDRAAARLNSRG